MCFSEEEHQIRRKTYIQNPTIHLLYDFGQMTSPLWVRVPSSTKRDSYHSSIMKCPMGWQVKGHLGLTYYNTRHFQLMVYYCVHGATILTGEKFKVSFDIQPPPLPHTPEAQRSPLNTWLTLFFIEVKSTWYHLPLLPSSFSANVLIFSQAECKLLKGRCPSLFIVFVPIIWHERKREAEGKEKGDGEIYRYKYRYSLVERNATELQRSIQKASQRQNTKAVASQ